LPLTKPQDQIKGKNIPTTLTETPEIKKPVRNFTRLMWKNNVNMDLKGIGCEVVDWAHLAQSNVF
jgi:hypothetical protein